MGNPDSLEYMVNDMCMTSSLFDVSWNKTTTQWMHLGISFRFSTII